MKTSAKYFGLAIGPQARQHQPKWPKTTSLMTSLTKNPQPPTQKFFRVQTRRLAESFEGLNSSLAQSA